MNSSSYIIISPVRNEAQFLPGTIEAICRQTIRPLQWVIVNDGSSDGTKEIITEAARQFSWILVVDRVDRGFRQAGSGVVDAFYDGYRRITDQPWDFLVKLDGDVTFESTYFERCIAQFQLDPKLGIAGGTVCNTSGDELIVESAVDPAFHVRGATKIYRSQCWNEIGGLFPAPGWDTVDEFKANMLGWRTRTFADIKILHHRCAGDAYGQWHNWTKNGLANYVAGYHPLFMLAKCVKRAFYRPIVVVATGLFVGFCLGYLKRIPQAPDRKVIRYVRQQQLRRLLLQPSIYG